MKKNCLSILLTLCLLCSVLPLAGMAKTPTVDTAAPSLAAYARAYHMLRRYYDGDAADSGTAETPTAPARLIVGAKEKPESALAAIVLDAPGDFWLLQYRDQTDAAKDADRLADLPGVTSVEPDGLVQADGGLLSWGYDRDHADATNLLSWMEGQYRSLPEVIVAVIDTGVKADHPFLSGRVLTGRGYDFVNMDHDATDDHYHGTHVAGTVADGTLPNVKILPVKVLNNIGSGTDAEICLGIDYAVEQGADVINLSLGGQGDSEMMRDAIERATAAGVIVCVSAGNENADAADYHPANVECAVTVGALDQANDRASFSNYGELVDLAAPGVGIVSSVPHGVNAYEPEADFLPLDGTSMASPHVAAAAANLKTCDKSITTEQALGLLRAAATPIETDKPLGFGALCMKNLINPAQSSLLLTARDLTLFPGQTAELLLGNTTGQDVTWTVSDPTVVSVSGGSVTAAGLGSAELTAAAGGQRRVCRVTVTPLTFAMNETPIDTYVGLWEALPVTLSHDAPIAWTYSAPDVAEVTPDGYLVPKSAGNVTVTATVGAGTPSEIRKSVPVRVRDFGSWLTEATGDTYVLKSARDLYELSILSLDGSNWPRFNEKTVMVDPTLDELDMSPFPDFIPMNLHGWLGGHEIGYGLSFTDFDGSNVPIRGLTIRNGRPGYKDILRSSTYGFFASTGGSIRNVRLEDYTLESDSISVYNVVGGISGSAANKDVVVANCYVSGTIRTIGNNAAGILGNSSGATVINCENAARVSTQSSLAAGILVDGFYQTKLINCLNTGKIESGVASCGIAAGMTRTNVMGRVIYPDAARPVQDPGDAAILNCVNVGEAKNAIAYSTEGVTVTNCYWLKSASNRAIYDLQPDLSAGIGADRNLPQTYSFDSDLIAVVDESPCSVVDRLCVGAMQYNENPKENDSAAFLWEEREGCPHLIRGAVETDQALVWFNEGVIGVGLGVPRQLQVHTNRPDSAVRFVSSAPEILAVDGNGVITGLRAGDATVTAVSVDGHEAILTVRVLAVSGWYNDTDPVLTIRTAEELHELAAAVNDNLDDFAGRTVVLANDVDISVYPNWTPIGDSTLGKAFAGTFDGQGNAVAGLSLTNQAPSAFGLFGRLAAGATVRDLTLTGIDVAHPKYTVYGSVAVIVDRDAQIVGCSVFGTVRFTYGMSAPKPGQDPDETHPIVVSPGDCESGGVAAMNDGLIQNCLSGLLFSTDSESFGGIVGRSTGLVNGCVHTGDIMTSYRTAGICLTLAGGYVTNCVNYGSLTGQGIYGGNLAGLVLTTFSSGVLNNSVNLGELYLTRDVGCIGGVAAASATESYGWYFNVVGWGGMHGGETAYALGYADHAHWDSAYWLNGAAAEGLGASGVEKSVNDVRAFGADLRFADGASLIETLNANRADSASLLPWKTDVLGRPVPDFGCAHEKTLTRTLREPTCTEPGSEGVCCAACGELLATPREIPARGHDFYSWVNAPGCEYDGSYEIRCEYCDYAVSEVIQRTGHHDNNGDGYCDDCGKNLRPAGGEEEQQNVCRWCGKVHTGFFGRIVQFFHNIAYFFTHLFR